MIDAIVARGKRVELVVFEGLESLTEMQLEMLERMLPESERGCAQGFKSPRRRRQFVLGRALLQAALTHFYQLPLKLAQTPKGKPVCAGAAVNITHSGDWAGVVLTDAELMLGVDIECYSARNYMRLARHYFSAQEVDSLNRCEGAAQQRLFFRYWVQKEAWAKCLGDGISSQLLSQSFVPYTLQGAVCYVGELAEQVALGVCVSDVASLQACRAQLDRTGFLFEPQPLSLEVFSPPSQRE